MRFALTPYLLLAVSAVVYARPLTRTDFNEWNVVERSGSCIPFGPAVTACPRDRDSSPSRESRDSSSNNGDSSSFSDIGYNLHWRSSQWSNGWDPKFRRHTIGGATYCYGALGGMGEVAVQRTGSDNTIRS
ncbi:hypothetical protein EV361DRAFT_941600 [Lentinula raphanica]|nr:hypothetical protein EV361DRAFT_941600 [Lentinula raphanica]